MFDRLYPGDDVSYTSTPGQAQRSGKILAFDAFTFTVQRYSQREDLPALSLLCLHIDEVCLTNETEVIPRVNIMGIMFLQSGDIRIHQESTHRPL